MRLYCPQTLTRHDIDDHKIVDALNEGLVPSVTTILNVAQEEWLVKWKIKTCLKHFQENGDFEAALCYRDETGANFGTICHDIVENYLRGKPPSTEHSEIHLRAVQPLCNWIDENVEEVLFTEKCFADSELGYAGTADLLVKIKGGELLLGDIKTTKHNFKFPAKPKLDHKYQLSAYRNHFQKEYGPMQIGNLVVNSMQGYAVKTPLLFPFIYKDQDWTVGFQACQRLWMDRALHEN